MGTLLNERNCRKEHTQNEWKTQQAHAHRYITENRKLNCINGMLNEVTVIKTNFYGQRIREYLHTQNAGSQSFTKPYIFCR